MDAGVTSTPAPNRGRSVPARACRAGDGHHSNSEKHGGGAKASGLDQPADIELHGSTSSCSPGIGNLLSQDPTPELSDCSGPTREPRPELPPVGGIDPTTRWRGSRTTAVRRLGQPPPSSIRL